MTVNKATTNIKPTIITIVIEERPLKISATKFIFFLLKIKILISIINNILFNILFIICLFFCSLFFNNSLMEIILAWVKFYFNL